MEKTVKGITVEEYNELVGYRRMVNEHAVRVYVAGEGYLFFDGSEVLEKVQKIADSIDKTLEEHGTISDLEERIESLKSLLRNSNDKLESAMSLYEDKIFSIKQMSIWEFIKWRKK